MTHPTKYIFITGGVCSSLGKGATTSSLGSLLESAGYRINIGKIDPYLNIDAGTMGPLQHGEVYVTDDGGETDLDLGNYERFTNCPLRKHHSITTGQIYQAVMQRERAGNYLGECVQVIPHITNEIKKRILQVGDLDTDIVLIEVGGTVGDIESNPFLEAICQLREELGKDNVLFIHLTLVPKLSTSGELKTKLTQHAVQKLREIGITPDILICRIQEAMPDAIRKKLTLFTHVDPAAIIQAVDCQHTIYELPINYYKEGLITQVGKKLGLPEIKNPLQLEPWHKIIQTIKQPKHHVNIGVVGKYTALKDAYISIYEALEHGGYPHHANVKIHPIDSETLEKNPNPNPLQGLNGILIPGGFGKRGIEGKIIATQYARQNNIPFLGICLGMQTMAIEYARNVAHLPKANSTEFDSQTPYPIIHLIETQKKLTQKGGTMRLGSYLASVQPNTLLAKSYQQTHIAERHRHRYEINNTLIHQLTEKKLQIAAIHQELQLIEAIEWPDHPWGIGVQYHPELKSKPFSPHPLFNHFIKATLQTLS